MTKFDSPLGSKSFPNVPMKDLQVPDESDQEYENMAPVMRRRGPALHGPQPSVDIAAALAFQQRMNAEEHAEDLATVEKQVKGAREQKRSGKERLSESAKRRIEMLLEMTHDRHKAKIGENEFVFKTLTSIETREAIVAAAEFDGTVQSPFEIRRQFLARSIIEIAGIEIAQFIGSNSLEARLELIDSLGESILNRLYDEYSIMVKESRDKFAIKSPEEVQEVFDDLKK